MKESGSFRRKHGKYASKRSSRLTSIKKKQQKARNFVKREAETLLKKQRKDRLMLLKTPSAPEPSTVNKSTPTEEQVITSDATRDDKEVPETSIALENDASELDTSVTTELIQEKETDFKTGYAILPGQGSVPLSIVALKLNSEFATFHGRARITLIKGNCTVNGFKMAVGCSYTACAPLTDKAMVLQSGEEANDQDVDIHLTSLGITVDLATKECLEDYGTLVVFETASEILYPLSFPGYPDIYKVKSSHCTHSKKLCGDCWAVLTDKSFVEYDCYKSTLEKILSYRTGPDTAESRLHKFPVTVAAGGKNTGKSTFNRYLVNRLLERYNRVYYLDCDIGQTEFTPSGFISLHAVTKDNPVLGPPFTHQTMPRYACYYGNKTPEGDPDRYIACIRFVLDSFLCDVNRDLDGPLVVNTMGWVRALGLHLLVDIIRMIFPTHVMQFSSYSESNKCEPLVPSYLATASGWMSVPKKELQEYEHIRLDVVTTHVEKEQYRAPDHRDLALLSRLAMMSQRSAEEENERTRRAVDITSAKPYSVKVSNLVVCNAIDSPIPYKYVKAALNCSIVGLCVVPDEMAVALRNPSPEDSLHPAPVCPCLGLGLVRGVDTSSDTVFIVSDLPTSEIAKVNCLICGHLTVPDPLLMAQAKKWNESQPYVTNRYPYETVGASVFKVHKTFPQLSNKEHKT